jgi:Peptidase A4 family
MHAKPLLILTMLAALPAFAQSPKSPPSTSTSKSPAIKLRSHGPMKLIGVPHPGAVASSNWSGYAVTGTAFTKALGSWIVPAVKCGTTPNSFSSYWVGIDGYSDNTVEQLGTDSDCSGKTPQYYAWYEFYPNASKLISNITVSPGDKMSATVSHSGTQFTLRITDHTTGKFFRVIKTFSGKRTSAEWIVEAPSNGVSVLPLADFTKVSLGTDYTGVNDTDWAVNSAVTGPISDFGSHVQKITMQTSGGINKAVPTALTTDGSSFKVTWKHE